MIALLLGAAAFAVTTPFVWLLRHAAERVGVIDVPNQRSSHSRPTPRGGGLAIAVVSLALLVVAGLRTDRMSLQVTFLLITSAAVAGIGLLDDVRSLGAAFRLCAQLAIAVGIVLTLDVAGVWSARFHLGGVSQMLLTATAIVWVVGMINAYNFMDGIDGIAGTQALIAGTAWAAVAGAAGLLDVAVAGAVVGGSAAGFLVYNWAPARIFMGDVGSGFLGFVFALLPLLAASDLDLVLFGVAVVWPFIFDTSFTFLRRLLRGENVLTAHRTHLYQRLVRTGFSHATITLWYAVQMFVGVGVGLAVLSHTVSPWWAIATLVVLAAASWQVVCLSEQRAEGRS